MTVERSNLPQVIQFHKYLAEIYPEIETVLGKIDPEVSDWDFEMNAGAAQELRKLDLNSAQ